jgi:hypothetical protein
VIVVTQNLEDYLCKYVQSQTGALKGCLLAALNDKDHCLSLLDESLGTPVSSVDLTLCEFLRTAGLFRGEVKLNRDGRNRYRFFYLTDTGVELAEQAKKEGYEGKIPESDKIL